MAWDDPYLYGWVSGDLQERSPRMSPRETFPDCCYQDHCPWAEPLLNHASTGDPPTPAGSFGSVSCGVTAPFLWVVACKILFVPSKTGVCFPQPCGSLVIKSHWPSRSDSLGIPRFFVGSPGWKAWGGFWTFTIVGELLWYYCSPVCGSPIWWVCDLILLWLRPSYHLAAASSLSLDMGYLFLVGSSVFLLMVAQQLVVILLLLEEEISACPSTLPSWTGRLILS